MSRILLSLCVMLSVVTFSMATPSSDFVKSITGTITDANSGEPLIGATVSVKGTTRGDATDFDGNFTIDAELGETIVFSYAGYTAQEIVVDERDRYDVALTSGLDLGEVTIVGSRGKARTDVEMAVPVDIISARELVTTGQTDLAQQIQFTSPSFNSAKYGVNGTTNYADPASLRGLGPDQSLVTVNGKRRHQFSTLNLNVAPGLGNVVTDLNSIPSAAVKRMEVLRDGAAAQYGSDAIAGIINLALNDQADGGQFVSTFGQHFSSPDDDASAGREFRDGFTIKNSLNYGFSLGKEKSFFNFTLEHFKFAGTNRSDYYTGSVYPDAPRDSLGVFTGPDASYPYATENPIADRGVYPDGDFVVGNYGSNENETKQFFVNTAYPIGDPAKGMSIYGFGGFSQKDITAYGFFRNPRNTRRSVLGVFPDGYVPISPGTGTDYSYVFGFKRSLKNNWNYDLSYSKGKNELYLDIFDTTNPSMGDATPTFFHVGTYNFEQDIFNADVSKDLGPTGSFANLNVAFGAQYRNDRYFQTRGDLASYQAGPLAAEGKDVGSSARPGIADDNDLERSNFGVYADAEADITDDFLVAAAVRFENYSDFGSNISGKLASRYKLTENFSVRGSYNRGFRAPSVQQLGTINNTSTVQNGEVIITRQVPSNDPRLAQLGVQDPEAEISNNYNLGVTAKLANGAFLVTVDAYQIDITDRIVITERLQTGAYPAVAALFPDSREIRFFTNQANTQTRGLDIVAAYKKAFAVNHSLNVSLAATFNQTEVISQKATPAEILAGAASEDQGLLLLGTTATELIEVAQPRQKILLNATYKTGKVSFTGRVTRFGEVEAFSRGLSEADANVECVGTRCVQTFAAKMLTDLNVAYAFSDMFSLSVGGNNLFDIYPDKYNTTLNGFDGTASSYASGQIPYSRNSNQFGFNGRYLFATAVMNF